MIRNPIILPYTHDLKRLDKIYLDTTFASKANRYRRFPTKADGLKELLKKIKMYPIDTVFHFNAWTFGYEDVWIALSNNLGSQVWLLFDHTAGRRAYTRLDSRRRIQLFFVRISTYHRQEQELLPRRPCTIWLRVWQQIPRRMFDAQTKCSPA